MIQIIEKILQAFKSRVFISFNLRFQSKRSLDNKGRLIKNVLIKMKKKIGIPNRVKRRKLMID